MTTITYFITPNLSALNQGSEQDCAPQFLSFNRKIGF